jgi:putative membrane protein
VIEVLADHFWHGGFQWFWLFGLLQPILWIALIALLVRVLRNRPARMEPSAALTILEERYARGEIGRDEFLERRSVLHARVPPA